MTYAGSNNGNHILRHHVFEIRRKAAGEDNTSSCGTIIEVDAHLCNAFMCEIVSFALILCKKRVIRITKKPTNSLFGP